MIFLVIGAVKLKAAKAPLRQQVSMEAERIADRKRSGFAASFVIFFAFLFQPAVSLSSLDSLAETTET